MMGPRNSTPHSKRTNPAHGYNPYARPTNKSSSDVPTLLPLDMVCDMDGTIASRKEARKKAKKVRFHQRAENRVTESGEGIVVFPAPAKEPSTPPRRASFIDRTLEASYPTGLSLEEPILRRNNVKPGIGNLSYGDLLSRVKGLESTVQQQEEKIRELQKWCQYLEKSNTDMQLELFEFRAEPVDEEHSPRSNDTFETIRLQKMTPRKMSFGVIPDVIEEDRPMEDVFGQATSSSSGHNHSTIERSDSPSSVLVFPSSSPSSDISEIATPNDSPYGVNRVIDENYDEGLEEYHQRMRRQQFARDVNRSLGIQDSMDSDQMLDRIAESMPRVWNIKEVEQPPKKNNFVGGLELSFPPLPPPMALPF